MIPKDAVVMQLISRTPQIREVSSIAGEPSYLLVISLREKEQRRSKEGALVDLLPESLISCAGCLQIEGWTAAV